MDRRDLQLSLVQDLLGAPGSVEGWYAFLLHLCDALGGSAASFISHELASGQVSISVTARTDPDALSKYNEHWHRLDPWAHSPDSRLLQPGAVVIGDSLVSRRNLRRTAFYNDFGRSYGIVQCIAGMIEVSAQRLSCLSINGTEHRKSFDAQDSALMVALMPSLKRALQIHRRLAGAELMSANAAAVLDRLPHGVLVLSNQGTVLSTNRAADQILRARDGLTIDHGELRAATIALTNQLRTAVSTAIKTAKGVATDSDRGLILPRPSGRPPLSIIVAPLPSKLRPGGPEPFAAGVALFVTDPDRMPLPEAALIATMFKLTVGESQLVRLLVAGFSLDETAAHLALRPETVRTRLKVVFQKTNTHRQAELVKLVLTGMASLAS